jgi:hypothetical protein
LRAKSAAFASSCPSIFGRKKPLAEATLRRIARGIRRYVLEAAQPFIVPLTHQGDERVYSAAEPLRLTYGERVRIVLVNDTMMTHPIHLHGHEFLITGTDGGPTPKSTRMYEVTTDVAVGQMRQIDFLADEEGDWAFHCHKSHHTMNAMGHNVPTMIGVDHRGVAKQITSLIPDYMVMGERGMADMTEMEMPLPDNTLPMMTGEGPFGSVEMGGMFSVLKVRRDQKPGDYKEINLPLKYVPEVY